MSSWALQDTADLVDHVNAHHGANIRIGDRSAALEWHSMIHAGDLYRVVPR